MLQTAKQALEPLAWQQKRSLRKPALRVALERTLKERTRASLLLLTLGGLLPGCEQVESLHLWRKAETGPEASSTSLRLELLAQTACPSPAGLDPNRTRSLGFKVRVTALTEEGIPANFYYASLLTQDGLRYLAELDGCGPQLSGRPLKKGEQAEGYVNFHFPTEKLASSLQYAPIVGTRADAEVRASLALRPRGSTKGLNEVELDQDEP